MRIFCSCRYGRGPASGRSSGPPNRPREGRPGTGSTRGNRWTRGSERRSRDRPPCCLERSRRPATMRSWRPAAGEIWPAPVSTGCWNWLEGSRSTMVLPGVPFSATWRDFAGSEPTREDSRKTDRTGFECTPSTEPRALQYPAVIFPDLGAPLLAGMNDPFFGQRVGKEADHYCFGLSIRNPQRGYEEYRHPQYEMLRRLDRYRQTAEEKRLLYVALTRARETLVLIGKKSGRALLCPLVAGSGRGGLHGPVEPPPSRPLPTTVREGPQGGRTLSRRLLRGSPREIGLGKRKPPRRCFR